MIFVQVWTFIFSGRGGMKNFKKTRQKFVHIHFVTFLRVRRTFSGEGFKPPLPSPGYGLVHMGMGGSPKNIV